MTTTSKPHGRSLGHLVSVIHRRIMMYLDQRLEPLGLSSGTFRFLHHLQKEEGLRQEELARRLAVDKGTTARAIKRLVDAGLVVRTRDPDDGRAWVLTLTDQGVALRPAVEEVLRGITAILSRDLTEQEREDAFRILGAMAEALMEEQP